MNIARVAFLIFAVAVASSNAGETNLITVIELDSARRDWPKSVKANSNITLKINFGDMVIAKGEVLPVLSVSNATILVIHAGLTNQIPAGATDIVEQINDVRRHRLIVGNQQYDYTRIEPLNPSQVKVFHRSGVAVVLLASLPPDLQQRFGYNSEKANAFTKAQAEQAAQIAAAQKKRVEIAAKCQRKAGRIIQVVSEGLLVQTVNYVDVWHGQTAGQTYRTVESRDGLVVLISGHPKQKGFVDGQWVDVNGYQDGTWSYTDTQGASRTVQKWIYVSDK